MNAEAENLIALSINIKSLNLSQTQNSGAVFINEIKNVVISGLSAAAVIDGSITLGMMLSIQYIVGQLTAPVSEFINFTLSAQNAKISLERINEIHDREDEESDKLITPSFDSREIEIKNLSFRYERAESIYALKDINLTIPEGKITAIVGGSGSGKTTLIKLLLGFYDSEEGSIIIGKNDIDKIKISKLRKECGVVMQEGYIFSSSIEENIAPSGETIDKKRLDLAIKTANIGEYIESLPLGLSTKIGNDGKGLSQGQKQRILIARAVYKDPKFLFFDEATNALDANNEKIIMENLDNFFKKRTAIVVAHRLSTVKNADQIVVLDKGKVVEIGDHRSLTKLKGYYYNLVKNQLELGN